MKESFSVPFLLFNGTNVIDIFDCAKNIDKKFHEMCFTQVKLATVSIVCFREAG
jgi:hypothetical protein